MINRFGAIDYIITKNNNNKEGIITYLNHSDQFIYS